MKGYEIFKDDDLNYPREKFNKKEIDYISSISDYSLDKGGCDIHGDNELFLFSLSKYDDDWYIVYIRRLKDRGPSLSGSNIYKCDQLDGLKELFNDYLNKKNG